MEMIFTSQGGEDGGAEWRESRREVVKVHKEEQERERSRGQKSIPTYFKIASGHQSITYTKDR